jgi:CRISPR-associated protein Cas2
MDNWSTVNPNDPAIQYSITPILQNSSNPTIHLSINPLFMKHEIIKRTFVVVAYDIADDKRRALLHRRLKRFGLGVQYSVFECVLDPDRRREMKEMVRLTIKPKRGDRVRYYHLCESCRQRIQATDAITDQEAPALFV